LSLSYLSVCSGIEAATVAWHPLGFQPLAFSEIEPFARAVLTHHYPDVPLHGDFTLLGDEDWIAGADILVGGCPCTAFSIAGLRKSLADARGNLTLEFVKLADAIDERRAERGLPPSIVVWENVPGVLSVRDNAFGCFLSVLSGEDTPFVPPRGKWTNAGVALGPIRAVAWRILDAQFFGLAQRRRRVFVVASAREGFDPAAVLLEFEGVRRDSPPRRETRQDAAADAASGADERRSHWDGVEHPHPTLNQSFNTGAIGYSNQELFSQRGAGLVGEASTGEISHCLNAGGMGRQDYETETLVTHALRGEGFDGSEDGTGRGTPLVPVAFSAKDHGADATEDLSPTLRAMPHHGSHANGGGQMAVAVPLLEVGKRTGPASNDDMRAGLGVGEDGDPMYTLQAGAQHGVAAYAFQSRIARNGRGDMGDLVNALTMSGETGKGDTAPCVALPMMVRRLTCEEAESLQGFPQGYTRIPWKKKSAVDCPDGPRYRALGNSMAVNVMRWIGERIRAMAAQGNDGAEP
jgi:DNA (cytosine-5)-methyltransferase 1